MIRLTRAGFRRWLKKNEGKIVGPAESYTRCPMCKYLKSKGAVRVKMDIRQRRVDGQVYYHRGWQRRFQTKAMYYQDAYGFESLRGSEAIDILDSV